MLTLVLMADLRWWEGRRVGEVVALLAVLAGGLALMWKKTLYPTADVIRSDWTRHLESGTKTVGMLAFLAVALWLLARPPDAVAPEGVPDTSARTLESPKPETVRPRAVRKVYTRGGRRRHHRPVVRRACGQGRPGPMPTARSTKPSPRWASPAPRPSAVVSSTSS